MDPAVLQALIDENGLSNLAYVAYASGKIFWAKTASAGAYDISFDFTRQIVITQSRNEVNPEATPTASFTSFASIESIGFYPV